MLNCSFDPLLIPLMVSGYNTVFGKELNNGRILLKLYYLARCTFFQMAQLCHKKLRKCQGPAAGLSDRESATLPAVIPRQLE